MRQMCRPAPALLRRRVKLRALRPGARRLGKWMESGGGECRGVRWGTGCGPRHSEGDAEEGTKVRAVARLRSQHSVKHGGAVSWSGSSCSTEGQRGIPGEGAVSSSAGCRNLLWVRSVSFSVKQPVALPEKVAAPLSTSAFTSGQESTPGAVLTGLGHTLATPFALNLPHSSKVTL